MCWDTLKGRVWPPNGKIQHSECLPAVASECYCSTVVASSREGSHCTNHLFISGFIEISSGTAYWNTYGTGSVPLQPNVSGSVGLPRAQQTLLWRYGTGTDQEGAVMGNGAYPHAPMSFSFHLSHFALSFMLGRLHQLQHICNKYIICTITKYIQCLNSMHTLRLQFWIQENPMYKYHHEWFRQNITFISLKTKFTDNHPNITKCYSRKQKLVFKCVPRASKRLLITTDTAKQYNHQVTITELET